MKVIYIIDGDQCLKDMLQGIHLIDEEDEVIIICNQNGYAWTQKDVNQKFLEAKGKVIVEKVESANNSADFGAALLLGKYMAKYEDNAAYVLVSNDRHFETIVNNAVALLKIDRSLVRIARTIEDGVRDIWLCKCDSISKIVDNIHRIYGTIISHEALECLKKEANIANRGIRHANIR